MQRCGSSTGWVSSVIGESARATGPGRLFVSAQEVVRDGIDDATKKRVARRWIAVIDTLSFGKLEQASSVTSVPSSPHRTASLHR